MAEIITCPACQRKLQVPEAYFGQNVQCPECQHMFMANPTPEAVQSTPPAPLPTSEISVPAPQDRNRYQDDLDDRDDFRDRPIRRGAGVPHRGGTILALGIISLIVPCANIVCGPMAWIMGNNDLREMRAGRMNSDDQGMTNVGRILGMVSTAIMILVAVAYCVIFLFLFAVARH